MARFMSILDTIGNTPTIRLHRMAPPGVNVYVKVEAFNPMGSLKDRMARAVIEDAEASGALRPGQTVIEATSGNTGIGLAMVCARKGYPLVVTMAENFSVERRKLLRFLGAKVVLTPAAERGSGMLAKAVELAHAHDWFLCRQFENEANAQAHSRTTAEEILADFADEQLDYWVSGYGTGGTLRGVSRVLQSRSPRTRIVVAEPSNAPVLASGIPQSRDASGAPRESHPRFNPHIMQGWAPDFIAKLTEDAVSAGAIDEIVAVDGADAMRCARDLARLEGIFVGTSSGATLAAALSIAQRSAPGTNILCMLPDTGERYLSTPLFADIPEAMTDEEHAISRSTPRGRFDASGLVSPLPPAGPALDPGAEAHVARLLEQTPVLIFGLQWCDFSLAVRKFLQQQAVDFRTIELDSPEYAKDDLGLKIRAALAQRVGRRTIPQIFIDGTAIGGCTELFDGWRTGSVQQRLSECGVHFTSDAATDPESFLPQWRQPVPRHTVA
jgi:cysteine synthase A